MYGIFHIRSVSVGLDSQFWYLFYLYNRIFECPENIRNDGFPDVRWSSNVTIYVINKGTCSIHFFFSLCKVEHDTLHNRLTLPATFEKHKKLFTLRKFYETREDPKYLKLLISLKWKFTWDIPKRKYRQFWMLRVRSCFLEESSKLFHTAQVVCTSAMSRMTKEKVLIIS